MDTPYNGLLLYHGVGVGKSCSSILIADNFKEYAKMNNKKIIILTKPTIQQGFRNEVFNSLVENNSEYNKLLLFNKTQKLLDRFLFIFFAEDRNLVPANSISKIII